MSELGVYIPCLNEEYMIAPCVRAIQKVFPQVEVIDLGSKDKTLKRLNKLEVVVHNEESAVITPYGRKKWGYSGDKYTELKNVYSKKHEWIFWVDGDEIWPEENLRYLKSNWEQHKTESLALRIAWRDLVVVNNVVYGSNPLANGPKLFNTSYFCFRNAWPNEIVHTYPGGKKQLMNDHLNNQWCWHGRMLNRSSYSNNITDPVRYDKRISNIKVNFKKHHPTVDWEQFDGFPWEGAPGELFNLSVPEEYLHDTR